MYFENNKVINNEDLIIMYPRRTYKERNCEIWQYPYVKNGVLSLDTDLVIIIFGEINKIVHLTKNEERLKDTDYMGRVEVLVHDLNQEFEYEFHVFDDLYSEEASQFIELLKV